jgi:hypothetical protein
LICGTVILSSVDLNSEDAWKVVLAALGISKKERLNNDFIYRIQLDFCLTCIAERTVSSFSG